MSLSGFRHKTQLEAVYINLMSDWGGLGDMVCRLPAIKYFHKSAPHVKLHVYWPDYFIDLANEALKTEVKTERLRNSAFSNFNRYNFKCTAVIDFKPIQITSMRSHLVDHAFDVLCDYRPMDIEPYNYPELNIKQVDIQHFSLPKNYVVITTGFTAPVREMLPEVVNGITEYLGTKGMVPVFLGKKETILSPDHHHKIIGNFSDEIDFNRGIDLRDKTSLMEAAKIMDQAKAVVGLDNGLIHLAGMTKNAVIVVGYSSVNPESRLPYRNNTLGYQCYVVTPDRSLECAGCQSKMQALVRHDFKECYYKDRLCLEQMTAEKYIKHLEHIL